MKVVTRDDCRNIAMSASNFCFEIAKSGLYLEMFVRFGLSTLFAHQLRTALQN